jgi:prefoldin subunit 5
METQILESDLEQLNHLSAQLNSKLFCIKQRLREVIVGIGGDYLVLEEENFPEPANNHISVYEFRLNTLTQLIKVMEKDLERLESLASK